MVAPLLSAGGAALGAGADATASALSESNPFISRLIQGTSNMLGGTAGTGVPGIAGTATRLASQIANGAATGGSAAALTAGASDNSTGQQVKQGMEAGAILGPAGALASKGLGYLGTMLGNAASPLIDISQSATESAAVSKLMQKFQADGLTPAEAIAKV